MSWKRWLTYNPYKKLWSIVGGRPWTYITRDLRQKYPLPWQLGLSSIMICIGHYYWGEELMWFAIGAGVGIIAGHFWWGTPYIPGQEGD